MHSRLWSSVHRWLGFDENQPIGIESEQFGHLNIPMHMLPSYPPAIAAWLHMKLLFLQAVGLTLLILVPIFAAYWYFAQRFGRYAKARVHERGAELATFEELRNQIEAYNTEQRNRILAAELGTEWPLPILTKLLGPRWKFKLRFATTAEIASAVTYSPYRIGGLEMPWHMEQSHLLLVGTTGTGKTVSLRDLLSQARKRNTSAVVFDLTGAFIEAFYDPGRDIILNPLDVRCPQWSIFYECDTQAEFTTAAEALVPSNGGSEDPFWVIAARLLFVEICMKLRSLGKATNQALNDELMTADLKHVHKLVEDTVADPITAPEAARMAEAVRAVFNANAAALRLLPRSGKSFSIKRWMLGDRRPGSILFLSARYVDMSVSKTLLTSWMDTAMNTLMTLERTDDVRMWFLVDEMGALYRMPALEKGLQTARNFGGSIVLGVHAFNKIKETYGDNIAITLSSLARSKLVLATSDRETATYGSDIIGHHQYKEMEEGYSYGYNNVRDAVTLTPRRLIEPLVLPDEINNLPSLEGYIKFPEGLPAAKVALHYVAHPQIAVAFTPRPAPIHDGDWITTDTPRDPDWKRHAEEVGGKAGPVPAAAQLRASGATPLLKLVGGRDDPSRAHAAPVPMVTTLAVAVLRDETTQTRTDAEVIEAATEGVGTVHEVENPPQAPTQLELADLGQVEDQSVREAREGFEPSHHDIYGPEI